MFFREINSSSLANNIKNKHRDQAEGTEWAMHAMYT